jgi:uncharacterized protein YbjT (DUF2867 family)
VLQALILLALVTAVTGWFGRSDRPPLAPAAVDRSRHGTVAVFGATGLIGEGVLAAMLADPDVRTVHVVTRRRTPELDAAAATGRAVVHLHDDFLDYTALEPQLVDIDAVYWALGTSAFNVSNEEYSQIHVDYPVRFVTSWLAARGRTAAISFHLVSGSGAAADSWFHWAREKARAEALLTERTAGTGLRVVAYRPGGIVRTGPRARWYTEPIRLLQPLTSAIEPVRIGEAMLEVTARGAAIEGGVLDARDLTRYANAYRARLAAEVVGAPRGQHAESAR